MKKALILYNSKAGHGRVERRLDAIVKVFCEGGYEVLTRRIEFGRNPFDEEPLRTVDLVVVCGGDGTINYTLNAMKSH